MMSEYLVHEAVDKENLNGIKKVKISEYAHKISARSVHYQTFH
ncbi:hypothetical protein ACT7DF_25105 [Bacillus cereus]